MTRSVKLYICLLVFCLAFTGRASEPSTALKQLNTDLELVWPLVQTVVYEYHQANHHLEALTGKAEKEAFLKNFENEIKQKYFKQVLMLNLRQGKLLLLLIHRELGQTPFDLLCTYRSYGRAFFWQQLARIAGADLKATYSAGQYPAIENQLNQPRFQMDTN
jgi:hypothetical protein